MSDRHAAILFMILGAVALLNDAANGQDPMKAPRIVGHRGLMRHTPENTLAGFAACMNLRLGFELDIRRTKDGVLVVLHDDDVKRTTNGTGSVAKFTMAELQKLDAGRWFALEFAHERVPTLDAVFALMKRMGTDVLVCLDIKVDDETLASEVVTLAKKHGILQQVMCIGLTIEDAKLRARLKAADAKTPVAVLANERKDLAKALGEKNADWIYVRFIPTTDEVKTIHGMNKRVFAVGKLFAGNEPENWQRARDVGVDAILTDYPIECQQLFRAKSAAAKYPKEK
jgi:glycerophosphoryl diester phosphodiesterase